MMHDAGHPVHVDYGCGLDGEIETPQCLYFFRREKKEKEII